MQLSTKTQGLSIVGLTLVVIAIVYAGAPSASNPETLSDHIGYMLRVTARLSFGALLLAYVARPLVQLVGWGRPLLIQRRYIGLAAAASLTVHFGVAVESGSRLAEVMATLGLVALCIRLVAWLSQRFKRTA